MKLPLVSYLRGAIRPTIVGVRRFGISYLRTLLNPPGPLGAVTVERAGQKLFLRPKDSDFDVYNQVFLQGEYDLSGFKQSEQIDRVYRSITAAGRVPIIIDAGANVGLASLWFATKFPQAVILSVEPDPDNAALARKNVSLLDNVKVVEAALGAQVGRVTLSRPNAASWAVTTHRSDAGEVPIVTIDSLMTEQGETSQLFIVKIDIEGFEKDVFSANLGWLEKINVLYVEPHDWMLPGEGTSAPLLVAVQGKGFDMLIKGENLVFVTHREMTP